MTTPLLCLIFFAAWTLALVTFGIGAPRVTAVLRGQAKSNAFPSDRPHGTDRYQRTMRAHANCVENLPVFGAVVLAAHAAGFDSATFSHLAVVYVTARVGQTVAHISSGRARVVNIRFSFFVVQLICVAAMIGLLVRG